MAARRSMQLLAGFAPVTAAGCSGGESSLSSDQVAERSSAVLVAHLTPGSNGSQAAALVQRFIQSPGVIATHGDAGTRVLVYLDADAKVADMQQVRRSLRDRPRVASVTTRWDVSADLDADVGEP